MTARQDLDETLKCFTNTVNKNISVVTPESLGQDRVYHIATREFSALVPNISKRAAYTEDNTLPRVHCAMTFMGCILGHSGVFDTAMHAMVGNSKASDYKGGFYIYQIPFEFAVKPNRKLVYDADETGEVWLVPYNRETRLYKPDVVGKFVIVSITIEKIEGRYSRQEQLEIVAHIPEGMRLPIEKEVVLTPGYWQLSVAQRTGADKKEYSSVDFLSHKKITQAEFDTVKKEKAALLSL